MNAKQEQINALLHRVDGELPYRKDSNGLCIVRLKLSQVERNILADALVVAFGVEDKITATKKLPPLVGCPRCDEVDERHFGFNRCALCECEFEVVRRSSVKPHGQDKAEG